jgi:DNA-directed RNA polymerase subunit K/omega
VVLFFFKLTSEHNPDVLTDTALIMFHINQILHDNLIVCMTGIEDICMPNKSRLTKYELSRILGIRVSQLSMSAPMLVDVHVSKQHNFMYVAALELKSRVLDIVIRRPLPMNKYYDININELDLPDDIDMIVSMYE